MSPSHHAGVLLDAEPPPSDAIVAARPWQLPLADWRFFAANGAVAGTLHWRWRAIASNGVVWEGDRHFATRALCHADAATQGYRQE
jgi:hypothetical protein